MSKFEVIGGRRLKGELVPQGAKNEALQVICACLLTREEVVISNIPEILDVIKLIDHDIFPVPANNDIRGEIRVVVGNRPLRVAGNAFRFRVL